MNSRLTISGSLVLFAILTWTVSIAFGHKQPIVVEGQVTNGTSGGSSVTGITMEFHHEGETVHEHLETITDEEGRFRFEGIEFDPAAAFGVSVKYQGALYGTDVDLSAGSPPPVSIVVYDSIDSADVLSVQSASLLFAGYNEATQTVAALEIVSLVNGSDRAYVPGTDPMSLVRFGLPPNALGLQVDTGLPGADFVQVDLGFALLSSVPPGEHEVMYAYEFPYEGAEASITKSFAYGAGSLRVLAPMEVMKLSSDDLGRPEAVPIGEIFYLILEAFDLPRGARVSVDIKGLTEPSLGERLGQRTRDIRFEYAAPIGLGMLMALVIGYSIWQRTLQRRKVQLKELSATETEDELAVVEQMLEDVESGFRAGRLDETEYQRMRSVLRTKLASLDKA